MAKIALIAEALRAARRLNGKGRYMCILVWGCLAYWCMWHWWSERLSVSEVRDSSLLHCSCSFIHSCCLSFMSESFFQIFRAKMPFNEQASKTKSLIWLVTNVLLYLLFSSEKKTLFWKLYKILYSDFAW